MPTLKPVRYFRIFMNTNMSKRLDNAGNLIIRFSESTNKRSLKISKGTVIYELKDYSFQKQSKL